MTHESDINEEVIDRFETAWQSSMPEFDDFVLARNDTAFLGTLQELAIIDMEFRWKKLIAMEGDAGVLETDYVRSVDDYVSRYPELSEPRIVERLAVEEFTIRRRYGDQPTAGSFSTRYPQLRSRLEDLENEFSGPIRRSSHHAPGASPQPAIAGYKLHSVIGEGGMGRVYLAEQEEPVRRRVAVKVIRRGLDSKDVIARFDAERQALAMMDHPNIARILEAGSTHSGQPYFAMEYVDGVPITEYCTRQTSGIGERLRLFLEVCAAVQHAHQKGILHRDIKPSNVLIVDHDGTPMAKVIDFGLAKAVDSAQLLTDKTVQTHAGQVLGTLKYMSPEQASTGEADIDTRADVYALGVMLYELLTGDTPLGEAAMKDLGVLTILEKIRDHEPVRPSVLLHNDKTHSDTVSTERGTSSSSLQQVLRGDLDWIVMRALEKERDRRYESAGSLADDVRRFLNDEPVMARPPSASYRIQKFARKNRLLVASGIAMLTLLLTGIAATSWQAVRATRAEDAATKQEELATARAIEAEALRQQEAVSRRKAEDAAARAERVLQFVVDSYHSADPTKGAKKDLLARDVLLQALDDVQVKMEGDLESQAALNWALASSLYGLGDYESAHEAAQLAAGEYNDLYGMESEPFLRTQNLIGSSRLKLGDGLGGMEYFAASLGLQVGLKEDGTKARTADDLLSQSPLAIETMIGIAQAWMTPPNLFPDLAIPEARRAKLAAEELLGESHQTTHKVRMTLAEAYRVNGRVEEAIETLQQAFEASRAAPTSLEAIEVALRLGAAQATAGRWQQASETTQDAVDGLVDRLGASHPRTLKGQCQLADCLLRTEQMAAARDRFAEVLARSENDGFLSRRATRGLARVALLSDDVAAALELYRSSPEDRAWVYIVAAQPSDAADAYTEMLEGDLDQFRRETAQKRSLNLLLWAKRFDRARRELERYDEAVGNSESTTTLGSFLDVPLVLIRVRLAIAERDYPAATSLLGMLLNPRVVAPSSDFLPGVDTSSDNRPLLSHILSDEERAMCRVLQAQCELEQQAVGDTTKATVVEAFETLRTGMPKMSAEQRWTVGDACETLAALCDREGTADDAALWRSQLAELEMDRVRFTLDDDWQSELQSRTPGPGAVTTDE